MKKVKKLCSILITFALVFTMSGVADAASDGRSTTSTYEGNTETTQAEIMGNTKCTIKKNRNKYYYYNAKGNKVTKKGWKKNSKGKLVYYVGKNKYVSYKIKDGKILKWDNKKKKFVSYKTVAKSGTRKVDGKYYYFTKNGNISTTQGWKKNKNGKLAYYVGKNGYVTAKIESGKYFYWKNGKFTQETLPKNSVVKRKTEYFYVGSGSKIDQTDGWKNNNTVYVKSGTPVVGKTIQIDGFYNTFRADGKRVEYKVSDDGKIVRSDTNEAVSTIGAYKVGSGTSMDIYYCNNQDGTYQTSGSFTINGKTYKVSADGTCATHVHQWSPLDENGKAIKNSEVINHKAKTEKKNVKIADEWTEWRQSDKKKQICLICVWAKAPKDGEQWEDENGDGKWSAQVEGRYYFKDYCFDTLDELQKHEKDVHNNASKPTYNYIYTPIHHEAQYEKKDVITEEAWNEWYEYRRCTECGEKMTVRVIKGKTTKGEEKELHIPSDSGEIYTRFGSKYLVVTKNKPFLGGIPDPKVKITAKESMKKYGFSYVGDLKDCNGELSKDWLLLLKDHNIDY